MHCLDDRIKAAEVSVIPGLCSFYFFVVTLAVALVGQ